MTLEDYYYLEKRGLNTANFSYEEIQAIKAKSVKICALNADTKTHNKDRIKALGNPIAPCKSLNKGDGASSASATEAGGLLQDISLAKGCRVLLTKNLWTEAGLTNGAVGTVKYIIYDNDLPPKQPKFVLCHFEDYKGPSYLAEEEKLVPIVPHEHHFIKQKKPCYREMIHCKYFSRNISGFYACPIISCTIFVLITALGCAQLSDVMNLISCTLFVSIATNRC